MSLIELSHPRRDVLNPPASPLLRLRVLVHRGRLDRLIAEGASQPADSRVGLRATQLARPTLRAKLAHSLLNALRSVDDSPPYGFVSPHIPVDAASVRSCSLELRDLARALTDVDSRARGVAITRVLLTDGGSPLYMNGPPDRLREILVAARAEL
jgi:hypothetical protein